MPEPKVIAVVVTHRRLELLEQSLIVLTNQTRPIDHLVVVDNDNDSAVAELVAAQPVPVTYIGSAHNLGGAGGFALGMLQALALGADWVWCADDDGRPEGPEVLQKLLDCAPTHHLDEVSPVVCNIDNPETLAFPLRRGLVWRRKRSELFADGETSDLLPGIASLMNGALFSAAAIDAVGVPDLRLFVRGDEVEMHRRLVRSGPELRHLPDHGLPPSGRQRRVPPDPRWPHAHPVPRQRDQTVLHLPQPRLSDEPAGYAKAPPAGVRPIRLVFPCAAT